MRGDRGTALLAMVALLAGCRPEQADPPVPAGTTHLPSLGARQVASYRCTVDLVSGNVEVLPTTRSDMESEPGWNDLSDRKTLGGRTFRIVIGHNGKKHQFFPDRVLVSVVATSGASVRTLRVQEFLGAHENHGPRALTLSEGRLRFFMQFWVNVE